jgi:hypothetical protein
MAESSIKSSLRPARMLTTAIMAGLALVAATLTWPALVKATGTPPSITLVQVASSKGEFFYSPLTDTGGSVYFNNLSGQGADQVITVTVTVFDDNPALFSGGSAFGIAPTTSVSNTDGTWSVTYTVSSSATTENGILFAITDGDSLSSTITISFTRDITPPAVAFTGFTDAQYITGTRWYRTPALTAGWAFTAAFTETDAGFGSSLAAWDHQTDDADDQAILPFLSGAATLTGTFSHVYTDADGTVVASLVITDHVGNSASTSMTLGLDGSAPSISSPDIIANSRYLYATGTGIYYGNGMGSGGAPFTVTGSAGDDAGVGLYRATFSSALGNTPPPITNPTTWAGVYTATSVSTATGTIVVTVTDLVGNAATQTFAYTRDITPPDQPTGFYQYPDGDSNNDGFAPAPGWEDDPTIDLRWDASQDDGSGLRTYHLGTSPHPSTPDVTQNSSFTVTTSGYYPIYLSAEDNVGNISSSDAMVGVFVVLNAPTGGKLNLARLAGAQYLYIANPTGITTGTLFYNNAVTSSFVVTGDTSAVNWGTWPAAAWKVAFGASWGDPPSEVTTAPYTHAYTISPGETNNAFVVDFVNMAGNAQPITIANTLDVTAPQVSLTDVTNPQYDPDHNELGTAGNWYRTSALGGGWSFTSNVTETLSGLGSSLAVWSHSVPTNSQTIVPGLTGSGTFTNVVNDSDGIVTVTVTLTDHVNNASSSDPVVIRLDGTPPTIATGSWGENSPYLAIVSNVLYYNPAMPVTQTATLSGTAYDNWSGLDYATFSQSPNLPSTPISDTSPITWSTVYSFSSATQANHVDVTVYDHVGNAVTATYACTRAPGLPSVQFTNVTNPGWDPDHDEVDTVGNWYASDDFVGGTYGHGWSFYATVTDGSGTGISAARATWDHATGPDYVHTPSIIGSTIQDSFEDVSSAPDGLVTVTLTITDNVGQVASDTIVLRIDNTPPSITSGGLSDNGNPYLYASADGSTLYFSRLMSSSALATLSGIASDNSGGSGLNQTTFSYEPSIPANPAIAPDPANWSNNYYFNASSLDYSSPITVVVSDNLGNAITRTYTYTRDITAPSVPSDFHVTSPGLPGGYYSTTLLSLDWDAASDPSGSGVAAYLLGTTPSPTVSYTAPTSYNVGGDGVYTFYLRAADNVGNRGAVTSAGPITVDTQAPVLHIQATPKDSEGRILLGWDANDATTWPVAYDVQYSLTGTGNWHGWITNTSSISAYFGPDTPIHVEFETPYYVRVRARDYVGNQSVWTQTVFSLGLKRVFLPIIIQNYDTTIPVFRSGDFESGTFAGWKVGGALPYSIVRHPVRPTGGTPPNGGTYAAMLGWPGYACDNVPKDGQAYIKAYVNVPAGTSHLRFSYRVISYDEVHNPPGQGNPWWDRLEVQVNGSQLDPASGNPYGSPTAVYKCLKPPHDSGWQNASLDLSPYAGQTVILTFFNVNVGDNWYNTWSYLDNIRIEAP